MMLSFAAIVGTIGETERPAVALKISSETFEMNVWLPLEDLQLLDKVLGTRWEQGALRLGRSASADVWWSHDDECVFIAAGPDDQTWDFGIRIPADRFAELRSTIQEELQD
jgi:hypothetical protein